MATSCLKESTSADEFPVIMWISSNACPLNLLLVQSHQAEIIIVKRFIQGCNNVTMYGLNQDHAIRVVVKTTSLTSQLRCQNFKCLLQYLWFIEVLLVGNFSFFHYLFFTKPCRLRCLFMKSNADQELHNYFQFS